MRYSENKQAVILEGQYIPLWAIESRKQFAEIKLAHVNGEILPFQTASELEKEKFDNAVQEEISWRDSELNKTLNRIDQYEKDQSYPENLRTSPIKTNEDFLLLLNDRKLLSDYPDTDNFSFGDRPTLSGLAK